MDSIKQGNNSETSSQENDQHEKVSKNDTMGTGRLYDCSFCKRGFTSAQALGGHMNIHRKDKAKLTKTKQAPTSEASNSNKPSKEYVSSSNLPPFMGHQKPYYPVLGSHTSYETFSIQTPRFLSQAESDCVNANLSLGIGIPYVEENEDKNRGEKMDVDIVDDVDLELRLGQKP